MDSSGKNKELKKAVNSLLILFSFISFLKNLSRQKNNPARTESTRGIVKKKLFLLLFLCFFLCHENGNDF